jgi:hypothetical protein
MNKSFSSPVNASNYNASLGTVHGCRLLGINYDENRYRFQLLDANEDILADGAVFGVNVESASEVSAEDDIRAAIDATNS